jgi:hypothetical protein
MDWHSCFRGLLVLVICAVTGCATSVGTPQRFDSPQEAIEQLAKVVSSNDSTEAQKLFGSEGEYLLKSGDKALDQARVARFSEMFTERHSLKQKDDGEYVVLIGSKGWPFAIPLVPRGNAWVFDAAAGREEIVDRRVGENEFSALDVARAVYLAQRQYAAHDWDEDGNYYYAARLISTPGKRDGLYWPAREGDEDVSPLGPAVVRAADESYVITPGGQPQPFHGYYHKLRYSPASSGARVDVLEKPGKYWLVSIPASWNESGVMTFASNERGWVYQKNLGADFDYAKISEVVVDQTWTRVE